VIQTLEIMKITLLFTMLQVYFDGKVNNYKDLELEILLNYWPRIRRVI